MKKPRMFRDEPAEVVLKSASRISDLKNLGATAEKHFHAAGIKSVQQFIKLGWKKSLIKLVAHDSKHAHSIYAYALIGALANIEWNQISETEKTEARQFTSSLRDKLKKIKK